MRSLSGSERSAVVSVVGCAFGSKEEVVPVVVSEEEAGEADLPMASDGTDVIARSRLSIESSRSCAKR